MKESSSSYPKYVSLAARYRAQIENGTLRPGDQLPSFAEVRAQLGVGQSTLEKAHDLLTQESLIRREPGRGVFVAPRRHRQKVNILGLIGIDAAKGHHPYFARLLEGIYEAAYRAGIEILLLHENSVVVPGKVDGILLYSMTPDIALRQLPTEVPCVSLLSRARGISSITVDDAQGIRLATQHLIEQGHRQIAYLSAWPDNKVAQRRVDIYRATLQEAGITPHDEWIRRMPNEWATQQNIAVYRAFVDWGFQTMSQWLAQDWADLGCTALLAHNDDTAVGAARALQSSGWNIPGQVSLVGYDDTLSAELMHPQLTTVHVPLTEIGARAFEILLREVDADASNPISAPEQIFAPTLKIRDSTLTMTTSANLPI